jgi:hypothetical protein
MTRLAADRRMDAVSRVIRPMPRWSASLPVTALLAALALAVAGCASATPSSAVPSAATAPSPTAVASAAPSPTLAASPQPTPTTAPSTTTTPSPTEAAAACPVEPQDGQLASDRLTDVVIGQGDGVDIVRFVFGEPSIDNPAGIPVGALELAQPPFTEAASGLPIEMRGERVVMVRFDHMSLQNDAGQPTYDGRLEFRPDLPALTDVVNFDMSEGVVGWLIGWDGPGCVTLSRQGRDVVVAIAHPAS